MDCSRDRAPGAAEIIWLRRVADYVQPDRHLDYLLAVLQHPAGPDRHAVVRPRGVLRPRRFSGDSRHQHYRPQQAADPAARGATDRWIDRIAVRGAARLGLDPTQRNRVRDDFAWRRRTDRFLGTDPAYIFRRRSRHLRQPHQAVARIGLEFWAANPDLLSGR